MELKESLKKINSVTQKGVINAAARHSVRGCRCFSAFQVTLKFILHLLIAVVDKC